MSGSNKDVVELLASRASNRPSIENRIERRLEVLREWLREGIPAGKLIPKSLAEARAWEDAELGIVAIVSPNEFTTTHPTFGARVRDVGGLLTALKKKFNKPTSVPTRSSDAALKFDRSALERQLAAAVSQWHAERDRMQQEKGRADSAEFRSVMLLKEVEQKDELIADLRRQLASKQGLRAVE